VITTARFRGRAADNSRAGILMIDKLTDDGGMILKFEVALSEQEVRDLRDRCNEQLNEV